jgi:hypothetical protein
MQEPTFEDLREAHKRACLHETPHPPDAKSDEMRDLVIWMIALRLASQEGGAILVSRDILHIHPRGDEEAQRVNLIRVKSVEEALEFFEVETPAGELIKKYLEPFWPKLIDFGLPLSKQMTIMAASKARFIQGIRGIASAFCILKTRTLDGNILTATTEIKSIEEDIQKVLLTNIQIDNKPWKDEQIAIELIKPSSEIESDYAERLEALKAIFAEGL